MMYIILSLKHGTPDEPMFWRANDCGYANSPFEAGRYTEEQVKAQPDYYNNGYSTFAIPVSDTAMASIGFKCSFDMAKLEKFWEESQKKKSKTQNG